MPETDRATENTMEIGSLSATVPDRVINIKGAICPHPLNLIRDAVSNLKQGEILKAICDHRPTADVNVPGFCKRREYPYCVVENNGEWEIYIRKTDSRTTRLEIRNLSKIFSSGNEKVKALDNINLTIQEGEFVCIVGASGCGKSTLLNIIAGLERPTEGEVIVDNKEVTGPGPDRVVVFQDGALFPWLNVIENVEFGLELKNVKKDSRKVLAQDYLKLVGLDKKFHKYYIHQISGGMKQRVALARALVMEPSILLMDEPFAALDVQTRATLQNELQKIWESSHKTVVFVTHNIQEAVQLGDRVVVFKPGKLLSDHEIEIERPRTENNPWVFLKTKEITEEITSFQNPMDFAGEGGALV